MVRLWIAPAKVPRRVVVIAQKPDNLANDIKTKV